MITGNHDNHRDMLRGVRTRRLRRKQGQDKNQGSLLRSLWSVGALGWLIVVPMVAGVFLGRWVDGQLGGGTLATAALPLIGLGAGCWLAWKRIHEP